MPALNAPFSPPPESTSQGSPETFAEARAASYSASESAKKRASGMPPMRAAAPSSAVKTMRSKVFCGCAVGCAGFRASASGAVRRRVPNPAASAAAVRDGIMNVLPRTFASSCHARAAGGSRGGSVRRMCAAARDNAPLLPAGDAPRG